MFLALYYISSRRLAIKLFTGLSDYDLSILLMLQQLNAPCHYGRLHGLLIQEGYSMDYNTYCVVLRNGVDNGFISRSQVAGNVLYAITLEGKQLLHAFCIELDRIVADKVRLYGNGFNVE